MLKLTKKMFERYCQLEDARPEVVEIIDKFKDERKVSKKAGKQKKPHREYSYQLIDLDTGHEYVLNTLRSVAKISGFTNNYLKGLVATKGNTFTVDHWFIKREEK